MDGTVEPAVRQAGSKDPVRRGVVETEGKRRSRRSRATRGMRRDGGVRKDALAEGIPGNQPCWGLPRFVRAGDL